MKLLRSACLACLLGILPQLALAQGLDQPGAPTNLLAPPAGGQDAFMPAPDETFTAPIQLVPDDPAPARKAAREIAINLSAQMTDDAPAIPTGVEWRIFGTEPGENGELPLEATASGGSVSLSLPPGEYLVHGSYGRAGGTKRLALVDQPITETLVLNAGGLQLDAVVG